MVGIERLVDQGELLAAEATLQIQQMVKHPRLVLSSHNHYQFTSLPFFAYVLLFIFTTSTQTKFCRESTSKADPFHARLSPVQTIYLHHHHPVCFYYFVVAQNSKLLRGNDEVECWTR